MINKFPWMMLVITYLLGVEYLDLSMAGNVGYGFITVAVGAFFIEMFKSGDVGVVSFSIDQLWAIIAVMLASGLMSYLMFIEHQAPTFYHWLGVVVIFADALLNPINAYRTALRNFGVQN